MARGLREAKGRRGRSLGTLETSKRWGRKILGGAEGKNADVASGHPGDIELSLEKL